jgi:hypothetical protein
LNVFSNVVGGGGTLRRLVWISRTIIVSFLVVMVALLALFGPFAIVAIVLVAPASISGFGTRLLRGGRLAGAVVVLTATLPCAALALAAPEGHAYTAPAAAAGSTFFALCCMLLGSATAEVISRPHRSRDGRAGALILVCTYLVSTAAFVPALVLGRKVLFAPAVREVPTSTSHAPSPTTSHCACRSGRPCSCPGG